MIVGILSDTHDRTAAMAAGVEVLRRKGAAFFIHCGDVGGEHVLDYLAGLPAAFVWGNTDFDRRKLMRYAADLEINCLGACGELELDGRRLAVTHGDDFRLKQRLMDEQRQDYLLFGHTHVAEDRRVGTMRLINPGALHRASRKTVALLDTREDAVTFLPVEIVGRHLKSEI